MAEIVVSEGWSVRKTEEAVTAAAKSTEDAETKPKTATEQRPAVREMQERLTAIPGDASGVEGRAKAAFGQDCD